MITKNQAVKALKENYRLETSMVDYTIDLLVESRLNDFKELMQLMANSKKFDYMAKLHNSLETLEKVQLQLTQKEVIQIEDFKTKLYNKLTNICEYLREDKTPTIEYIKNIDFNNIKNADKTMYFEPKEIKVNLILGDSLEIYRLSTQNKTLLQEKIKKIVLDLVKQNKTKQVAIGYKNNPVAKLMNKGK